MKRLEETEVRAAWLQAMEGLEMDAAGLLERFGEEQPDLWPALIGDLERLSEVALSTCLSLLVAVWQVFACSRHARSGPLPAVDAASVRRWQKRRCDGLAAFLEGGRRIMEAALIQRIEEAAANMELRQPVILGFAVECLLEAAEDDGWEDAVVALIFGRLVLLIECLDRVC